MGRPYNNIQDQRFGKLVACRPVCTFKKKDMYWVCQCDCGQTAIICSGNLLNKKSGTKSCGCNKGHHEPWRTHGLSHTRLYRIWDNMKKRCFNRNYLPQYMYYGGRGITICDEWKGNFKAFYDWAMANGYKDHLTLDRYPDNNGNYEPSNCRWVTMKEQNSNRRPRNKR